MLRWFCIVSVVSAGISLSANPRPAAKTTPPAVAQAALARVPLRFEANEGQFDPSVRYLARAGSYTLLLTAHGPVYSIPGIPRIGVTLVNASAAALEPVDLQAARTDYYLGQRDHWHTGVKNYAKVRYRSVYPGVDLLYYGSRDLLEYDFLLQPGADPGAISMRFDGAPEVSLSPEGDLVIESAGRRMVQRKPYVYQEDGKGARREISGTYVLAADGTVSLRLGRYDRSRALVVDPVVEYCTYVGGPGTDQVNAAKLLPNGLLYLVGQTDSGQIPYINGAYNNDYTGLTDVFLQIIDTTPSGGNYAVYSSYIGGANNDVPNALDVDSQGIFYVAGWTTSTDFPMAGNSYQATGAGTNQSCFVFQLNPALYGGVSLLYSSYLSGTTGADTATGIAVDANQVMYIVGTARSSDFPISLSAYQSDLWGPSDVFIAQMDPNAGTLPYSSYVGGEDEDFACCILLGANHLVYFAVSTFSAEYAMAGYNYSAQSFGGEDAVLVVMDLTQQGNASLVYSTYLGGSQNDAVQGMAFDNQGNIILTGYTISPDFPRTSDAVQTAYNGDTDAWVAVLNPSLPFTQGLLYSTYLGGSSGDAGTAVSCDSGGNIYVTGYTLSPNFPIAGAAPQTSWPGGGDIFITELKRGSPGMSGILFSTYIGATGNYMPMSMAVGQDGTMYLLGYSGIGLPTSGASAQGGFAGGMSDGFILVVGTPPPAGQTQSEDKPRRPVFQKRSGPIR